MRTITLEEYFASPGFLYGPGRELKERALKFGGAAGKLFEQLCDLGDKRLAEMDIGRIDTQVLSLTSPGSEQLEAPEAMALAHEANDFLAGSVKAASIGSGSRMEMRNADTGKAWSNVLNGKDRRSSTSQSPYSPSHLRRRPRHVHRCNRSVRPVPSRS